MDIRPSLQFGALAVLLAVAGAPSPGNAVEIGAVGAVDAAVSGAPPAQPMTELALNDRLYLDERIVSTAGGKAQAMFLDQTTLTIAENSDIVLDRYVYDPSRGEGEIALSLARGAMRFIGGRITKTQDATIQTPVATIGIRGGITHIDAGDGTTLRVIHIAGEYVKITAGSSQLTLSRPGAVGIVDFSPEGYRVRYAGLASPADMGEVFGDLATARGGGARTASDGEAPGDEVSSISPEAPPVSTMGEAPGQPAPWLSQIDAAEAEFEAQNAFFSDPDFLVDIGMNVGILPVGGAGLVRGQLSWRNSSDLDLHLILPDGAGEVFFGETLIEFNNGLAVAELDADNLGDEIQVGPDIRVENITVTGDAVPAGIYTFFVVGFTIRDVLRSDFQLLLTGDGGVTTQTILGSVGEDERSADFPVVTDGGGF